MFGEFSHAAGFELSATLKVKIMIVLVLMRPYMIYLMNG